MKDTSTHILFVLPSFTGGGAERVTLTLMRALDPARFSTTLAVLDNHGPLTESVPADTPVTDLKTPRLRNALFSLIAEIRKTRPDVVFSTLGYVNLALLMIRPLLPRKTRIIVREANMPSLSLPNTSHPFLLRMAYRLLYRRADTVICTSLRMMEEMRQRFAVPSSRLSVLPNPVDETAIRNAAASIKRRENNGVHLVGAGRLTWQKGFDQLIDIMPKLSARTTLTILGDGPEQSALETRARDMNVSDRVHFAGYCNNPWHHFANADAFVMTSRWEGLPNVALEALACGTPVIATPQSGGIAEIASAAVPGAVTVVEAGKHFLAALTALSVSPDSDNSRGNSLRASLLPEQYRVTNVIPSFQDILAPVS